MKGFFKFLAGFVSFFAVVIGALAIFDKFTNKNALKDNYLDCNRTDDEF